MRRCAALVLACLAIAPTGYAVQLLHWDRIPLDVPLIVGEERVVLVDRPVRIGLPTSLSEVLRVQSADGAVYLRASAPMAPTRVQLQDLRTGELILLDVTASTAAPHSDALEPIRIVDDLAASSLTPPAEGAQAPNTVVPTGARLGPTGAPVAIALTRYAAQSLYAPLRTVEPLPGITPLQVPPNLPLDTLLPTLPVRASALAAWRLGDDWVTAVKLTNTSDRWIELDPRLLQGEFVAATFQHPDLGPAGRSTDTTVVYLVTHGSGIAQALLPRASRFDATLDLPKPASPARSANARSP